ncbi:hypothetical protein WD019_00290 [Fictibacillus sp. Mic-4]|uniref:hypothetical protein n=1 Tax=Fictibacillus TaxID=1329200 RepID=UPI000425464A|nr:hypothetical protein [Fictibacillus gelatini]
MSHSYEYYHRTGTKVTITDIPDEYNEKGRLSFKIMLFLQKQIDEIDGMYSPLPTYRFKED